MEKIICLTVLAFVFSVLCFGQGASATKDCNKDVTDHRGPMIPWEKGAWETGKYRSVFLEAGYQQPDMIMAN